MLKALKQCEKCRKLIEYGHEVVYNELFKRYECKKCNESATKMQVF